MSTHRLGGVTVTGLGGSTKVLGTPCSACTPSFTNVGWMGSETSGGGLHTSDLVDDVGISTGDWARDGKCFPLD